MSGQEKKVYWIDRSMISIGGLNGVVTTEFIEYIDLGHVLFLLVDKKDTPKIKSKDKPSRVVSAKNLFQSEGKAPDDSSIEFDREFLKKLGVKWE